MKCQPGNHVPGCYCFLDEEQKKYPINCQVRHTPRHNEDSHGYGVVLEALPSGHLIVVFDSEERHIMSPFELENNNK